MLLCTILQGSFYDVTWSFTFNNLQCFLIFTSILILRLRKKLSHRKDQMNGIILPTPLLPNHPCSNTNVPTGLLVFFIMQVYWILQVFIPEKQVLAKISIEPIKEASCLTEMWTGLYPVLTRLRLTVTGSSSVRMIPKSIISAGEYRPGTEK